MIGVVNMEQPRDTKSGQFRQTGMEPKGDPIALRLPRSLDTQLREVAGADLKRWIETAIAEKLAKLNS
jgi:hypothetical protein